MDFGDILKDWESRKRGEASERAKRPLPREKESPRPVPNPGGSAAGKGSGNPASTARMVLERWLDVHGVDDKDGPRGRPEGSAEADPSDRKARIAEIERIRRIAPQDTLDLHGMGAREAESALGAFIASSASRGMEKVLIVHGKGNHSTSDHVMTGLVRSALERNPLAGSFGPADREMGGRGATWVRVRTRGYFSR